MDEIAYNNHDVDDGLKSGMFTVEQIRAVALFREAHDEVLAAGIAEERILRHQVVRRIINRCTRDLLETTLATLRARRGWRRWRTSGTRAGGWSATRRRWRAGVRELKDFLFKNMYRHYRVVRMGDKAGRILRDLFESYVARAAAAPAAVPGAHRAATARTAWSATTSRA